MGREVVLGLLERGARVAAVDLNEAGLAETATLAGAADRLSTHVVNVSDRTDVLALPDTVMTAHGKVDGLFNVAGIIQPFVKIAELDFDVIERVIDVNFWGVVNMTKAFLPHLLGKSTPTGILNVSSMGGFIPVPGQAAYGASKAAVKLFTEALYAETKGTNLSVTVLFPGGVGTNITRNSGVDTSRMEAAMAGAKPRKTVTPKDAGRQIIEGFERGSFRVMVGSDAKFMDRFARLSPKRATELIANQMKALLG